MKSIILNLSLKRYDLKIKNNILYEQRAARDCNSSTHIHNLDDVLDTWCNIEDMGGRDGGALFQVRRKRSVRRGAVYDARTYIHRGDILYAPIYIYNFYIKRHITVTALLSAVCVCVCVLCSVGSLSVCVLCAVRTYVIFLFFREQELVGRRDLKKTQFLLNFCKMFFFVFFSGWLVKAP